MVDAVQSESRVLRFPNSFGKYEVLKMIGSGRFSVVALVKCVPDGRLCAAKVVSRAVLNENGTFGRFEQEIRTLQSFRHKNIVALEDVVFTPEYIYLVMEYCPNGDLLNYITSNGCLTEEEARRIFNDILSAIAFLHSKGIVHRDIKPENILIGEGNVPKLADFGLCRSTSSAKQLLSTFCGSPYFAPPEIVSNVQYDGKKSDIWSLGICLYAMMTGSLPWTKSNQREAFYQIMNSDIAIPYSLPLSVQRILTMMLEKDPAKRPTAEELLQTDWVAKAPGSRASAFKERNAVGMAIKHSSSLKGIKKSSRLVDSSKSCSKFMDPIMPLVRRVQSQRIK